VFPAFVVQTIVGMIAFLGRDIGTFFVVFAVFAAFMLASALPKRALAAVLAVAVPRFLVAGIAEITGRPGMARQATHGTLAIQLRDIERQAGVRRTL
jgi:cell division protein FtsW (lipid II flippase)